MAKTRSRIVIKTLLNATQFSKINRVYFLKTVEYGSFIDQYDYHKVRLSFKSDRIFYTKDIKNKKSARSLYRVRAMIYRIVQGNLEQKHKSVFFTLTFMKGQSSLKSANRTIKSFIRRLSKYLGQRPKYIIVPELHKTGNIHYHGVFFGLPYINIIDFKEKLWKQGYVDLQLPKKIKSVARYLCKYMTKDTIQNLPINQKAYFTSRNLRVPVVTFDDFDHERIIKPLELTITNQHIKQTYKCKT